MRSYAVDHEFGEQRHLALRMPECHLYAGQLKENQVIPFPSQSAPVIRNAAQDLKDVHAIFQKWLGQTYDTDVLDAVLAAAVGHWLPGDPAWLLVVAGSGALDPIPWTV